MIKFRLHSQDGMALIMALLVMTLLLVFGFALLTNVDSQRSDSRRERERESSFQLSEGVLNAQIFQLSTRWPSSTTGAGGASVVYPTSCTQTSTDQDCPSISALTGSFNNVDQSNGNEAWTTQVRDNGGASPNYYSDDLIASQPTYDANNDGFLWVRATAVVRGHRRTLVALVKAEQTTLNFPKHTLSAGYFTTSNNGNKTIIDNDGANNEFTPGEIYVRCTFPGGSPPATGCADYQANKGQVSPERVFSDPNMPSAVTPEALDTLRNAAKADGNYYATGCAPSLQGNQPGEMVFMEDASAGCSYTGNDVFNTTAKPGYVMIAKGSVSLGGTTEFHGVIYNANTDNSNNTLVTLQGNASIFGAVVIDGRGGMEAGSSKENLTWDPNVFNNLRAFGTAAIVQNTFREINATW
jgi:Tfp pilus assembly protein PilX